MMKSLLSFALLVALGSSSNIQFRELGIVNVSDCSFLNLNPFSNGNSTTWVMTISTFGVDPFADDTLYVINGLESQLNTFSQIQPTVLSDDIDWPNEATKVPAGVFSSPSMGDAIVVAGGFLVPGKSTGAINLFTNVLNQPQGPYQISVDSFEWFYHEVRWKDMDGDGLKDAVSARAYKSVFGSSGGQFLFYQQPSSSPLQGSWNEFILFDGPDIFFEFFDVDQDGQEEMIATQFFSQKVVVYWTTSGNWSDVSSIQSNIIDDTIGAPFGVSIVDLNLDGKHELLITNHVDNTPLSGVYVYEVTPDWKTSPWPRHTIASGFPVTEPGYNQASPGGAIAFWPMTSMQKKEKPWILLSGDGSQDAYLLMPEEGEWKYSIKTILQGGATVGQIAVADVDGDGYVEFFIPLWDTGVIYGYTFSPQ